MGPYVFKQFYERANTSFSGEEDLVEFNKLKHWEFDPEKSEGSLSDEIWSVNMIALTLAEATRYRKTNYFEKFSLKKNSVSGGQGPGMRMTTHSCST